MGIFSKGMESASFSKVKPAEIEAPG